LTADCGLLRPGSLVPWVFAAEGIGMTFLRDLLELQPLLTLFLVIGLGYSLGAVSIRGFSLGVGAVLFVGLAVGAFAPGAAPPALVSSIGLVLFLYGIGVQYGRQFVAGLTGSAGRRQNMLALVALALGAGVAVAPVYLADLPLELALGLFAGALTSTPTLQAAIDATGNADPSIGYSVAYPLGVIVPILCIYIALRIVRPHVEPQPPERLRLTELLVRNVELAGRSLATAQQRLPTGVQIAAIRRNGVDLPARPDLTMQLGDDVLVVGAPHAVDQARLLLGEVVEAQINTDDRSGYVRIFVSRPAVVGRRLADLRVGETLGASVVNVRRGDAELIPRPELVLEYGDRIGLLADPERFAEARAFFGNSIKGTAEFSYISLGIGMVLGVMLGLIRIPIPGLGSFALGLAGGPLIMALILGYVGRTGALTWTIPLAANLTLRTFGLTLFLATVGLRSGELFAVSVQDNGLQLLAIGGAIVLVVVLSVLLIGNRLLRIPYDDLLGVVSGVTGNPAILAYSSRAMQTDRPDVSYAIIFPGATVAKIILVQVLAAVL
jgi:putative transport protein